MIEIWKEWKPGIMVSNQGNIIGRKPYMLRDGYLYITYKYKNYLLHRIIAELFINNSENKPCVDHINRIRTDNRIENLRWVTHKENSRNTNSNKKCICIETGEIFKTLSIAAEKYNITSTNISNAILGHHRQKTAGGYHWKYYEKGDIPL